MRIAFKEWAAVVDALGSGRQILILRKGGIHEGKGGFEIEHDEFLLFPTRFHQQRDCIVPLAQARFDQLQGTLPPADLVRIDYSAKIVCAERLRTYESAAALAGQHIWREEVIQQRFDWGREKAIWAFALRVFVLPKPVELPMMPDYGGCKSWLTLAKEISPEGARPVLTEEAFHTKLADLRAAFSSTTP